MKTTVEISDSLLREVREVAGARRRHPTDIGGAGLHRVVAETKREAPFKLRRAGFKGNGRQPEFRETSWDALRDLVYQNHGT